MNMGVHCMQAPRHACITKTKTNWVNQFQTYLDGALVLACNCCHNEAEARNEKSRKELGIVKNLDTYNGLFLQHFS